MAHSPNPKMGSVAALAVPKEFQNQSGLAAESILG
jgi:hypothetical protein